MKEIVNYKKEIKKRISLMMILCIISFIAVIFGNFFLKGVFPDKERITDSVVGFFTVLGMVSVFYIFKLTRVYNDEKILKKYFLKETDEREVFIRMKSGSVIIPILSMLIVISSFVVAYVSYEAFFAMMVIASVQIVISFVIKVYWQKRV